MELGDSPYCSFHLLDLFLGLLFPIRHFLIDFFQVLLEFFNLLPLRVDGLLVGRLIALNLVDGFLLLLHQVSH